MVDINEENKYFRLAKLLLVHQTAIPNDTEKIDFIYSIFSKNVFFPSSNFWKEATCTKYKCCWFRVKRELWKRLSMCIKRRKTVVETWDVVTACIAYDKREWWLIKNL